MLCHIDRSAPEPSRDCSAQQVPTYVLQDSVSARKHTNVTVSLLWEHGSQELVVNDHHITENTSLGSDVSTSDH